MSEDAGLRLFPAWRQAEADLLASGVTYGAIITEEWLRDAFGLPKEPKTIAEHERCKLVLLQQKTALRESLLSRHRMMLRPVPGVGYTVVMPADQTAAALKTRGREVESALRKLHDELLYVAADQLDDASRAENTDALSRLGTLSCLVGKQLQVGGGAAP